MLQEVTGRVRESRAGQGFRGDWVLEASDRKQVPESEGELSANAFHLGRGQFPSWVADR